MRAHVAGLATLAALAAAGLAHAHAVGVSRGEYRASDGGVLSSLVLARPEALVAAPGLDADRDGSLSAAELTSGRLLLEDVFLRGLLVSVPGGACEGRLEAAALTEQDGLAVRLSHRCSSGPLTIRLSLLASLSLGHRHLATLTSSDGEVREAVLYEASPEVAAVSTGAPLRTASDVAWPLFRLGIQHILTGYDHLLFLFGLVLVGGRLRSLFVVVTAFTLAHSLTLALAVLGVMAPSPALVEPLIALSIAYVGIENFFVRDASRRWLITFPFGLIHGFGFAGTLREIALPAGQLPVALAAFNVGVEVGQMAALAVVLPGLVWLGRKAWFHESGVKLSSAAIVLAGLGWFIARVT